VVGNVSLLDGTADAAGTGGRVYIISVVRSDFDLVYRSLVEK